MARARRRSAALEALTEDPVLIAENGIVVETNEAALAGFGEAFGTEVASVLSTYLGTKSHPALTALSALEARGERFDMLAEDGCGAPVQIAGRPRGGQVLLTLRPVLAPAATGAHDNLGRRDGLIPGAPSPAALETIFENAPVVAWAHDGAGRLTWSAGWIETEGGIVEARLVAEEAAARKSDAPNAGEAAAVLAPDAGAAIDRFRLTLAASSATGSERDHGGAQADAAGPVEGFISLDVIEMRYEDGTVLGLGIDATAALSAERSLARFVRTMTDTFAHLNVGLAIFDAGQNLVLFNPALAGMWHADPAKLARKPSLLEVLDDLRALRRVPEKADFHAWRERLLRLFDDPDRAAFEELWHLSDGTDIRVLARPHPRGALAFVFEDVTERLRLEQRVRHSADLRRETLSRLHEGLVVFGPDGRLQLVNEAFHEIWGTDEVTAGPSMHASELLPVVRGLTVETDVWDRLMRFVTSAGAREAWSARLTLGNGRILGLRTAALPDGAAMAVFGDVTDSERIAIALRERNEALEAVEEMRAAVLDRISHRLRTPLNTISGFGQLLTDPRLGLLTEAQRGYADGILEAASHLLSTVNDVTELASLEIDPLHHEVEHLSLGEVLLDVGQLLEHRAIAEGVSLSVAAAEVTDLPDCDAGRLKQIVFGMVTDGIDRCRPGGSIALSARAAAPGRVEIYTLETFADGHVRDVAAAEAQSLTLPYLRRLIAQEGGIFGFRTPDTHQEGEGHLSAVCALNAARTEPLGSVQAGDR